jgi:protein-tyrosine phosphatase
MKILFICTGNICRSPTAEAIARQKAIIYGVGEEFIFDSAGINSIHSGESPDPRAVEVGEKYCISFDGIKSRQIQEQDFAKFDLILAMAKNHYDNVLKICPKQYQNKVHLLLQYCQVENKHNDEVYDPYYKGKEGFEEVFHLIDDAITNLFEERRNEDYLNKNQNA